MVFPVTDHPLPYPSHQLGELLRVQSCHTLALCPSTWARMPQWRTATLVNVSAMLKVWIDKLLMLRTQRRDLDPGARRHRDRQWRLRPGTLWRPSTSRSLTCVACSASFINTD